MDKFIRKFALFAALLSFTAFGQSLISTTSGTITASGGTVTIGSLQNMASVGVTVSGTWSATLVFEGTIDGTNWFGIPAAVASTNAGALTTTANGQWMAPVTGLAQFRVRASAYSSGTATVTLRRSTAGAKIPEAYNSTGPAPIIACDKSAVITVGVGTTVKILTGAAGKQIYVCGFSISGDTTATVAQFETGTGTNCGTSTAAVSGAYKLAANATLPYGGGLGTIFAPIAASTDFCLVATTGSVAGTLTYTTF